MQNPAESQHTMTNIEDGGTNAPENATDQKVDNALNEPTGNEDLNAGGENREVPEDGGQDEGQVDGQEEGAESALAEGEEATPEPFDPNAFKEDILKSIDEKMTPPAAPPAELTEEQWAAKETEVGVPRQSIQFFTAQAMKVYETVMNHIEERFAKLDKVEGIRGISKEKGFEDATRYQKEIDQYLSRYHPKHHSNPQLLKDAVIYARGLNASKNIQRVRTDQDRNKKIAGPARPSSPNGGKRVPTVALNASQRDVATKFGMSETEYQKLMKGRGTPIAS